MLGPNFLSRAELKAFEHAALTRWMLVLVGSSLVNKIV
jgi:hypothetical protein